MFGAIFAIALIIVAVLAVAVGLAAALSNAGKAADKNFTDKPVAATAAPCPEADANIVSIDWLDGDNETIVSNADQWVNLPVDASWVNGAEIKNKDRLGMAPRMKVKFDKAGSFSFKVKLLPPTGTDAYTDTEKGRNAHFKYTEDESSFTTDADGTKIVSGLQLLAGGGYIFQAEAQDMKGKKVKTGNLTTKRLFYYVEAKMTGLTSVAASTADVETEFAKHHMVLKKLSALSITHQENIGNSTDSDTLAGNVTTAVDADATVKGKKPYLLTVAYTDHLAVKNSGVVISKRGVDVGPGKPKVTIPVTARGLLAPNDTKTRYLWHDIVAGEGWFVSARYIKGDGSEVTIPAAKVTSKGTGNYWDQVEVDVTALPAGNGKVEATVNVVDRMRGGLALSGANQTCVCTRAWWANKAESGQVQTIIHEAGHKVGMVANGSGSQPDATATHYSGSGHAGDHCYKGCTAGQANYSSSANTTASECVMFGTGNGKSAFCGNCEKAVKKLDINAGW